MQQDISAMTITQLTTRRVEKPWGRSRLWPGFDPVPDGAPPIGEVWFQMPDGSEPELLVKYLFTDEKLSVQVHPDDARAHKIGQPRGKSEAWLFLDAEPGANIGLGLKREMSEAELREAALDGSIEQDMAWPEVHKDEFVYLPAGTIHALGAGLTVIEVQQTSDTTYRLYDYGRPRELHVEAGVEASHRRPYDAAVEPVKLAEGRTALLAGPIFVLERWTDARDARLDVKAGKPAWFIPVSGSVSVDGESLAPGTVWLADAPVEVALGADSDLLIAYPGAEIAAVV
jgi:mannose-6-phosphate isomerase